MPLPEHTRFSTDLFACKVVGESMNKVIPNGSICLFRKDNGGSRNGKNCFGSAYRVSRSSDFGSGYTVKEYHSTKDMGDDD